MAYATVAQRQEHTLGMRVMEVQLFSVALVLRISKIQIPPLSFNGTGHRSTKPGMGVRIAPGASREKEDVMMIKTNQQIRPRLSEYEKRKRFSDYVEYQRGKKDGSSGLPLSSIREIYIEGYILGRMIAHEIRKN